MGVDRLGSLRLNLRLMATWRRIVFALVLSLAAWAAASAREKPHVWLEVRSPHFQVVSNADAKQAGKVADQFERIRSVFHAAFPGMSVDPAAPMTILAIKDEKTFKTLVPESWLEKGQLQRSGMFLGGMDRNYVLLRLETREEDPYAALYHEYTHLLLHQNSLTIPTWMDEGLAEFYAHSEIHEKEVWLGRPSKSHLYILRETKLIPLSTLFSVNYTSPYYNAQNKGTIFYAESWALVHYLMLKDTKEGGHRMGEFAKLLRDGVDAFTAAGRAFGDSSELQKELENYLQQPIFSYLKMKTATEVDDSVFQTRELPLVESSTVRGDFLAHNGNYGAAKDVLDSALRADSTYAPARESMGLVEFYQSHRDEAKNWFEEAVKLN